MPAITPRLLCTERHDRTGAIVIMREDGVGLAIRAEDAPALIAQLRDLDGAGAPADARTAFNAT